ncbi:hypothetical protein ACTFIR_002901 [Dictyostelium discoideum]
MEYLLICCNNKTYCISGILCKGPNSKITDIIEEISKIQRNIQDTDLTQPLLQVKIRSRNYNISNFVNGLILTQQFLKSWGKWGYLLSTSLKINHLEVDEPEKEQPEQDQTSLTTLNKMNTKRFRAIIKHNADNNSFMIQSIPSENDTDRYQRQNLNKIDLNNKENEKEKLEKDQQHGEDDKLNDLNQKELFTKE